MIANMKNPLIETTAQRLKNYVTLIRLDRLVTPPLPLRTLGEHIEILEAFVARDPDRAEAAIAPHFQARLPRILGMFQQRDEFSLDFRRRFFASPPMTILINPIPLHT